ncbi:CAAX protease self-immunity [Halogranum amylolyticum]|uniref:CAAX protease self-immunity n=1 Tax=Halogranum amylolyticum TaxID=660520 RepID=A0A1H8SNG8_9EURY|nr:CPBP family intramembrane glutamic endopeptidase [Halogranum amylolyticum]SEO80171.1 CAAX protease self-immunity [Halogranum amylolyticum]
MDTIVERRPLIFTLGIGVGIIALAVVSRLVLAPLLPQLTREGIGLLLNWIFVAFSIGLVSWLGWWDKVRLTAPANRRALVYLLPFAAIVFLPIVFGMAVPEVALIEGETLPAWATIVLIVVGVALGAAISEELLYRGVLLRALEPRGRLYAGVVTATVFGLTHVSQIVLGAPVMEWLVTMFLIIPTGIGLAAVTFRLESLWPLVVWHFAVDSTSLHAASMPTAYVASLLGLTVLVGAMGIWLLRHDDKAARPDARNDLASAVIDSDSS